MLNREQKSVIPADDRIKDLDDKFIDYLYDKISNIRKDLEKRTNCNTTNSLPGISMKRVIYRLAVNKLSPNVSKTKYMLFHFRQRTLQDCDTPKIRINETDIGWENEFDFLGLTINENMT